MNRLFLHAKCWLVIVLLCGVSSVWSQEDDFRTWTKMKVNYKIDSRFSVSGDVELRTKDDLDRVDRWGLTVGGTYRACSFLSLGVGYETHLRNVGHTDWKFRHRYHATATFRYRYQWLKLSLRERFQQTIYKGDTESRLRSRLKLAYAPRKAMLSPYFSVELYQSLDDASFWRAARMRYRPGVEIAWSKRWSTDVFYCYQHESAKNLHIAGIEVGYSF